MDGAWRQGGKGWDKGTGKRLGGGRGKGGRGRAPGSYAFLINRRKVLVVMAQKGATER